MTVLARPAPLQEYNQPDHNACGYIATAAVLDTLGLPTDWTVLRTAGGGDANGTVAAQLVTAAKSRDPSVFAVESHGDVSALVAADVPLGYYLLVAGYCWSNAEPAPPVQPVSHWYIVYGTGWETTNIWMGTYPTYPNLAASYVQRLGCVILGRTTQGASDLPLYLFYAKDNAAGGVNAAFVGDGLRVKHVRDPGQLADILYNLKPISVGDATHPVADPGAFGSPVDVDTAAALGVPFGGGPMAPTAAFSATITPKP